MESIRDNVVENKKSIHNRSKKSKTILKKFTEHDRKNKINNYYDNRAIRFKGAEPRYFGPNIIVSKERKYANSMLRNQKFSIYKNLFHGNTCAIFNRSSYDKAPNISKRTLPRKPLLSNMNFGKYYNKYIREKKYIDNKFKKGRRAFVAKYNLYS
jgi:hypothetical protein